MVDPAEQGGGEPREEGNGPEADNGAGPAGANPLEDSSEPVAARLEGATVLSGAAPTIQWYPGHIAKAEKALTDHLAQVDLVIEVRDARIPLATGHPRLRRWIGTKPHLLVLNRRDMVSASARQAWDGWFRARGQTPWWCDAKAGTGVKQLQQAAIRAGEGLNARRISRGMKARPVRALMLGFPNVGKSALINRLVRQKVVESARKAGVTRSLRWVRLGQDLDLLDAPGVLPPRLDNQQAALRLALCDDIGQAAYDTEAVALAFVRLLVALEPLEAAGVAPGLLERRYGVPLNPLVAAELEERRQPAAPGAATPDAEAWLLAAASRHTSGDGLRMAQRLLDDFRRSLLGPIALELPDR
jgi:ribosome biogenesis GTPase A